MPGHDLVLLTEAAEAAGQEALRYWRKDPKVWEKGDGAGPVTEADLAVDALLADRLQGARPDYGWLSEETEDGPDRLSKSRVFILDPIDGTRSFIAGERTWAISVAVVEDGVPVAGVIYLPARDVIFAATAEAATRNGARIGVRDPVEASSIDILAPRAAMDALGWTDGREAKRHFRPSLAYRMALVAEGRFDAMITLRDAWEWDIAAGSVIARAAGAAVSDRAGQALRFNSRNAKTDGVLVADQRSHGRLMNALS